MDRRRFLELQPWCAPCSVDLRTAGCTLLLGDAFCCFYAKGAICFFAPAQENRDPSQLQLAMYIQAHEGRAPTLLFELDNQPYLIDHTKIQNISSPAPEARSAPIRPTAPPPSAIFHFSNLSMRFWASPTMSRGSAIEKLSTAVANLNSYLTAIPPIMSSEGTAQREAMSTVQAKEQLQHKRKRFQSFMQLLTAETEAEMPECCLVAALTGIIDGCQHTTATEGDAAHIDGSRTAAPTSAQKRPRDERGAQGPAAAQQERASNVASAAVHLADSALTSYSATLIVEALRNERVKLEQAIAETLDEMYPATQKLPPAWATPATPQTLRKPALATPARQPSTVDRDACLQRLETELNMLNDVVEHQYFIHCLPRAHGQATQPDSSR